MGAAANLLAGLVFALLLLRHAVSCALGLFPGENWLWRVSFGFGFDLLPVLSVLRDQVGCGSSGTFAILAAFVIASNSKSFFISLVTLHVAAFAVWFCWIISIIRYGPAFELAFQSSQFERSLAIPNPLGMLSMGLLLACVHSHIRYIKTLRGN
jgi:hypothetical protein